MSSSADERYSINTLEWVLSVLRGPRNLEECLDALRGVRFFACNRPLCECVVTFLEADSPLLDRDYGAVFFNRPGHLRVIATAVKAGPRILLLDVRGCVFLLDGDDPVVLHKCAPSLHALLSDGAVMGGVWPVYDQRLNLERLVSVEFEFTGVGRRARTLSI